MCFWHGALTHESGLFCRDIGLVCGNVGLCARIHSAQITGGVSLVSGWALLQMIYVSFAEIQGFFANMQGFTCTDLGLKLSRECCLCLVGCVYTLFMAVLRKHRAFLRKCRAVLRIHWAEITEVVLLLSSGALLQTIFFSCGNIGLFCGNVALFCGFAGLFCGDTGFMAWMYMAQITE